MTRANVSLHLLVLLGLALVLGGCWNLAVVEASPRPNVMVAADLVPTALVLDPAIPDQFAIPSTGSVNEVSVRGWRATLQNGFTNAFPSHGSTPRTLQILQAELTFAAVAAGYGGTAAIAASIRFKARLLGPDGNELAVLAGTVRAGEANTSATEQGCTHNAAKAVEALYETLARDLLSRR